MKKDIIQSLDLPFGMQPQIDVVKVEDFYNANDKKIWDNLVFNDYIMLLYEQYTSAIQLGYISSSEVTDSEFRLDRPVQDSITNEVIHYIKASNFEFEDYIKASIDLLEDTHRLGILNAHLTGEIPTKEEYNVQEGVRRVSIEYCKKYLNLTTEERNKVIGE